MDIEEDAKQCRCKNREKCQKDEGHPDIDAHAHDDGKDCHKRGTDCHADQHLVGVLNVRDICRHPRHERGGGELVDVCEGEVLCLKVEISS